MKGRSRQGRRKAETGNRGNGRRKAQDGKLSGDRVHVARRDVDVADVAVDVSLRADFSDDGLAMAGGGGGGWPNSGHQHSDALAKAIVRGNGCHDYKSKRESVE